MKSRILLAVFTISCMLNTFAQETIKINTSKSDIKWSGEYTFYLGGHDGRIHQSPI